MHCSILTVTILAVGIQASIINRQTTELVFAIFSENGCGTGPSGTAAEEGIITLNENNNNGLCGTLFNANTDTIAQSVLVQYAASGCELILYPFFGGVDVCGLNGTVAQVGICLEDTTDDHGWALYQLTCN